MEASACSINEVLYRHLPGGVKENHEISIRKTGLWLEILI
jgi:hypothetical protein